jgi:hypothetical protein
MKYDARTRLYTADCGECKKLCEAKNCAEAALSAATGRGWKRVGHMLLCPDCWKKRNG